jgi:hypothetical protein
MTENDELERMGQEVRMAYLTAETEENHENL